MNVSDGRFPIRLRADTVRTRGVRSVLPIHVALTSSSPFEIATLLESLRQTAIVRERLVEETVRKRSEGVYGSREMAEQTAQAILHFAPSGLEAGSGHETSV